MMRHALKGFLFLSVMVVVCAPAPAQADFYVNPWAGLNFGNAQLGTGVRTVGISVGSASAGFVGSEASIGYAPGIFGSGAKNYLLDLMSGFTLGPTFGPVGRTVRPYGLGQVGTIRTSIGSTSNAATLTRNDIAVSFGGGLTVDLNQRVAFRGDIRYLRSFNANGAPNTFNVDLSKFHYWRAAVGIAFY